LTTPKKDRGSEGLGDAARAIAHDFAAFCSSIQAAYCLVRFPRSLPRRIDDNSYKNARDCHPLRLGVPASVSPTAFSADNLTHLSRHSREFLQRCRNQCTTGKHVRRLRLRFDSDSESARISRAKNSNRSLTTLSGVQSTCNDCHYCYRIIFGSKILPSPIFTDRLLLRSIRGPGRSARRLGRRPVPRQSRGIDEHLTAQGALYCAGQRHGQRCVTRLEGKSSRQQPLTDGP